MMGSAICVNCSIISSDWLFSDEADRTWPPLLFRFFPDIIGSPVRQHYWLRSRQRHIRVGNGRLNHDDYHLHLSWIVIISVETCFAFRLEDKNGPHVFGADSVYYLNLILLLHHHHLYFNSPVKADTFKAFSAKKRALL